MRIKRIIIHNIASIADATIDFTTEPLTSSPIFLITGQTGAGKSTIIDAICLALYAETPRMARTRVRESYVSPRSDGESESININDNRQLMRRGAGECFAELLFTANDDHDYLARWQLRRAYGKPSGNIGKEEHTYCDAATGTQIARNRGVDNALKLSLIGLTFEQFCRTSLLAQGEFTRFLHASGDEKSEILEKLTGMEIYSKIGQRIFSTAKSIETQYNSQRSVIDSMTLLSDEELAEQHKQQADATKQLAEIDVAITATTLKINWIQAAAKLANDQTRTAERTETLRTRLASDDFAGKERTIAQYDLSVEARVRLNDMAHTQLQLRSTLTQLPALQQRMEQLATNHKAAIQSQQQIQTTISAVRKKLDAHHPAELNHEQAQLLDHQRQLNKLASAIERHTASLNDEERQQAQLRDVTAKVSAAESELATLEPRLAATTTEVEKARQRLARFSLGAAKAADELRATLAEGDICPICGNKIEHIVTHDFIESQLQPLREELSQAERELLALSGRRSELSATAVWGKKALAETTQTLAATQASVQATQTEVALLSAQLNVEATPEAMRLAANTTDDRLRAIAAEQGVVAELTKKITSLSAELSRVVEAANDVKNTLDTATTEWQKLTTQKQNADTIIEQNRRYIDDFCAQHEDLDMERLKQLNQLTQNDVDRVRQFCNASRVELQQLKGSLLELEHQVAAHEAQRPPLADGDTLESLQHTLTAMTARSHELHQLLGGISSRLDQDKQQRNHRAKLLHDLENLHQRWMAYSSLSRMFGDAEGKKFRNIAQSYILMHILDQANHYLATFTDRYRLTCNPGSLVILVHDNLQGFAPQGINILSGGESFMVSLSLALALAHIGGGSDSVDTLFIDEGFGTLSEDYLEAVMDTLEKLRQHGGRRVGIISHVEQLGERIPVKVEVSRVNPTTSSVRIVSAANNATFRG